MQPLHVYNTNITQLPSGNEHLASDIQHQTTYNINRGLHLDIHNQSTYLQKTFDILSNFQSCFATLTEHIEADNSTSLLNKLQHETTSLRKDLTIQQSNNTMLQESQKNLSQNIEKHLLDIATLNSSKEQLESKITTLSE